MIRVNSTVLSTAAVLALSAAVATATSSPALLAQATSTDTGTTGAATSPSGTAGGSTAPVLEIVEVTQAVPVAATGVSALTVPAGTRLIITDVLVTNPNTTPACGVSVSRGSGATVTGVLCAPAQSTLDLSLTTGLEFAENESVQLVNASTGAPTPLSVHMRGFLVAAAPPAANGTGTGATAPNGTGGTANGASTGAIGTTGSTGTTGTAGTTTGATGTTGATSVFGNSGTAGGTTSGTLR